LKEAEETIRSCGVTEETLRREWDAQVKAQTKPLPRQHKNQGKSAVEEALRLRKSRDAAQDNVNALRKRIIDMSSKPWDIATAELELETALQTLRKAQARVTKKENNLGVDEKHQLRSLMNSPFLMKKMNAQQHINELTQDSVKRRDPGISQLASRYNRLCEDMETLIRRKKAPRNSVAPIKIEMEILFELDVNDDIWLDVGLGYDDDEQDGTVPPLWLSNDNVRLGIRAMTDRDRCLEEQARLLKERSALQIWFSEEWRVVNAAIEQSLDADIKFQLQTRKDKLCRLLVAWERTLVGVPVALGLPEWGPTTDELTQYRAVFVLGGGVEMAEESSYEYDVDFEADADGLLVEHLDSLRIYENYRELHDP
ncbi:hypothetical protein EV360DRAFT_77194, partial [Lentinula raphanica]